MQPDSVLDRRAAILAAARIAPDLVKSATRLGNTTFNTAYRVRLTDGSGLLVKIAPGPDTPTMAYEHDLLRTEALFYRTVTAPVPRVLTADFSRRVIDRDFLVMTELPGDSWHDLGTRPDHDHLRHQLGGIVAGVHRSTGTTFGYPHGEQSSTWRSAFLAMVESILRDADRFAVTLPRPADRIRGLLIDHAHALDEVTTPVLVHFDLWNGNILLGPHGITGLIDAERAFWGDPLADLASLTLFRDHIDEPFRTGYLDAGGTLRTDQAATRRLAMYRCHLYLIMLVETAPRGHVGPEHRPMTTLIGRHLVRAMAALEPRTV
ncbi:phosphotransferase family protein [Actinokineospora enzanensis]|uniref:phosphotransferase family protein n=1 Tax=Actinokineospora enzanensis TaxID=155975 RepID=UPI000367D5BD|nr:aminoglycoside phosphotransferase family protein [Actinokineospora enzanensis]